MSTNIQQTSAGDRIEAARKALSAYEERPANDFGRGWAVADDMADVLRALITPPAVGESEEQIAKRVLRATTPRSTDADGEPYWYAEQLLALALAGVRAGIQQAHETWEPETAQRPSQEQMLRWLGVGFEDSVRGDLYIRAQYIEKEEL